jgi:hypothetical protein
MSVALEVFGVPVQADERARLEPASSLQPAPDFSAEHACAGGAEGLGRCVCLAECSRYAATAAASPVISRVRLGSTFTPGPIVEVTVIERR